MLSKLMTKHSRTELFLRTCQWINRR